MTSARLLQKTLSELHPKLCVDIGCGPGELTRLVQDLEPDCLTLGVDLSLASLAGMRRGSSAEFAYGDGLHLPVRTHSVDICFAFELIEHLDEPAELLREVRRVLRPRGVLLLSTPNTRSLTAWTGRVLYAVLGRRWNAWDDSHRHLFSPSELTGLLEAEGFTLQRTEAAWFFPEGFQRALTILSERWSFASRLASISSASRTAVDTGFITFVVAQSR